MSLRRSAFSLAEMMIALAILGIGLLFIAAALPVGVEYAKQGADISTGDAAADEAFQQIKGYVRTSRELLARQIPADAEIHPQTHPRVDSLWRPRCDPTQPFNAGGSPLAPPYPQPSTLVPVSETLLHGIGIGAIARPYEPIIKVRALSLSNIGVNNRRERVDDTEALVREFLTRSSFGVNATQFQELDFSGPSRENFAFSYPGTAQTLFPNSFLPAVARFYPSIASDQPLIPTQYFEDMIASPQNAFMYDDRPIRQPNGNPPGSEALKSLDRRIAWTAFYRRASYAVGSDPLMYEFIVVVTRRPSATHRFAVQSLSPNFDDPSALPASQDCVAPVPWLVTLVSQNAANSFPPALQLGADFAALPTQTDPFAEFVPSPAFNARAITTIDFRCRKSVARLLAPGSVLIPARNDMSLSISINAGGVSGPRECSFIPSSPDALPIYEVQSVVADPAGSEAVVTVKFNGAYPYLLNPNTGAEDFPFWVVPSAFVDRGFDNQPNYERKSSIVAVSRRIIRVPEIN